MIKQDVLVARLRTGERATHTAVIDHLELDENTSLHVVMRCINSGFYGFPIRYAAGEWFLDKSPGSPFSSNSCSVCQPGESCSS